MRAIFRRQNHLFLWPFDHFRVQSYELFFNFLLKNNNIFVLGEKNRLMSRRSRRERRFICPAERKEIKEILISVTQISQITQIYFQSPAALGIPKGDACYRRDGRNREIKEIFMSHRFNRSHRYFYLRNELE